MPITPQWLKENQAEFMELDEERKRNLLGEMMYKKVNSQNIDANKVSKVTGMLIDLEILEIDEIVEMLTNDEVLVDRINEAIEVINESNE